MRSLTSLFLNENPVSDQFRAIKILQERVVANPKIEVLWNCVVDAAEGENQLERAIVRNIKEDKIYPLPLDGLFVSIGMDPHTEFVKGVVELNEWGEIKVDFRMATSQPGIYAAGDPDFDSQRHILA